MLQEDMESKREHRRLCLQTYTYLERASNVNLNSKLKLRLWIKGYFFRFSFKQRNCSSKISWFGSDELLNCTADFTRAVLMFAVS